MRNRTNLLATLTIATLLGVVSCAKAIGAPSATSVPTVAQVPVATSVPTGTHAATPTTAPTAAPTDTLAPPPTAEPALKTGDSERWVAADGIARPYWVHVARNHDSLRPAPILFVFHGYTMSPADMTLLGFNDLADSNDFLVVYPVGWEKSWNAGGCCGLAAIRQMDDVAYVRQILSALGTVTRIDTRRVFATGFSNGAMFSYRLACEMSDVFAAIAPISGPLVYSPCVPQEAVSVMDEHGLSDVVVPFAGGLGASVVRDVAFPPVEQGIATWVRLDGCSNSGNPQKQGTLTQTIYSSCREDSVVELYTIDGQVHMWPGISFTRRIWDFLATHPKA